MTTPALPPGTRPGTGGYTAQLPASAGTAGQARRVASVSGKHHVEEWYTPVSASDIADAVNGLASETYVDNAIAAIDLPTRDSLGLDTNDVVTFGGITSAGDATVANVVTTGAVVRMRSNAGAFTLGAADDAVLRWDGAGIWAQRNGANSQEFRVYEQYTSDSNRSYLSITATTGGDFVIEPVAVGATLRSVFYGNGNGKGFGFSNSNIPKIFGHIGHVDFSTSNALRVYNTNGGTSLLASLGASLSLSQGLGAFGVTPPASQPAAIADASDAATTQSSLNSVLAALRSYGLIAT